MNENTDRPLPKLRSVDKAIHTKKPINTPKKAHSVEVNGREVFVAYRTLKKREGER